MRVGSKHCERIERNPTAWDWRIVGKMVSDRFGIIAGTIALLGVLIIVYRAG